MPSLSDFGSLVGNDFNQNQYKDSARPNGFCHGICIDWMRRTLGGGRSSILDDPHSKRTPEQQAARTAENVGRMKTVYDVVNEQIDRIGEQNAKTVRDWQSLSQQSRDQWNETKRVHGPWGYVWDSFMNELDAKSTKNRKFGDLSHVSGQAPRDYTSVREFVGAAVKVTEFGKWFETALLLGPVWKKNGADTGGHAIVLYRLNTGSIQLFDPNFGCYQVDGKFLAALEFLCNVEYANWGTFAKGGFDRLAGPRTTRSA